MKSEQLLGVPLPDEDEINHDKTDTFSPWIISPDNTCPLAYINISGDDKLQIKIRQLCKEFEDIFSNELPAEPADIPPFELDVDV